MGEDNLVPCAVDDTRKGAAAKRGIEVVPASKKGKKIASLLVTVKSHIDSVVIAGFASDVADCGFGDGRSTKRA